MAAVAPAAPDPGWRARLDLAFVPTPARTVLARRRHEGPLRVQRSFHPEGAPCHSYVLHPPGGVVGGDRISLDADVREGAWALLTTPGATKFYRSLGRTATLRQNLRVAPGATLEWLPQEQIVFSGAIVEALTRIDLGADSRCFAWELNCLGRPAGGLPFESGSLRQRLEVWREGRPVLLEHARIEGGSRAVDAPWGLNGQPAFATLVAGPADADALTAARGVLAAMPGEASATRLEDLLVVRWRGAGALEGYALRERLWAALRPLLMGRPMCRPRIWNT
ncbi:urease accessory protein [Spiribacter aquaticus]|uniref:Urease accessory protein UreD n=1 Tax=Spiribacter aquaticus TaxID=1935996 RepID=A0A557RFF3_9GAMM|nr:MULTISPECIES: urease accessory protein UreD [Spiribacter]KAF0280461.1 Urease accessory protein UreD [Spiribacter roseus]TVO63892.1 urease accessory protein [Spiribacter aquaticus]